MARTPRQPKPSAVDTAPNSPVGDNGVLPRDIPDHEVVEVVSSEEKWSVYKLADGTVVRVKPVVAEFVRVIGQYDESGEPLYLMKGGLFPSLRVPKALWRK